MDDNVKFIKPSGTGNKFSTAKKAPMSAKRSQFLGDERTYDAFETATTGRRPHHAHNQISGGEQKRRPVNDKPKGKKSI